MTRQELHAEMLATQATAQKLFIAWKRTTREDDGEEACRAAVRAYITASNIARRAHSAFWNAPRDD